jgi:hypothetical protein
MLQRQRPGKVIANLEKAINRKQSTRKRSHYHETKNRTKEKKVVATINKEIAKGKINYRGQGNCHHREEDHRPGKAIAASEKLPDGKGYCHPEGNVITVNHQLFKKGEMKCHRKKP